MAELTHWKKVFNPDYLSDAHFLPDEEKILTIAMAKEEDIPIAGTSKTDRRPVLYFTEKGIKPMVINKTNGTTLQRMFKTPYMQNWPGHKIKVYVDATVKFKGEVVGGLRIRPKEPVAAKDLPELTPEHEKWDGAVKALAEGRNDIDGIKKYFSLSVENEQLLTDQAEVMECHKQDI